MLKVKKLLAQLLEDEHLFPANTIGAGLHQARMAAQCLTDPDRHTEHVVQLLSYLDSAITELEAARNFVRRRA
jgi:hypothetical protein